MPWEDWSYGIVIAVIIIIVVLIGLIAKLFEKSLPKNRLSKLLKRFTEFVMDNLGKP